MIRNFCIIAHIDHGKSTLADRMLEITQTIRKSEKKQVLDRMDLEQERGITIKLTPVRMQRKGYEFNLIDTPGHVDFQYEVSRSLAAVEGAILLVDASQGIQAQTLSTLYMAMEQNLEIIPILNKIDLPAANPQRVAKEIENTIGIDSSEIIAVSAKTGENVDKVLDAIIERIQDPQTFKAKNIKKFRKSNSPISSNIENSNHQISPISRALIFDSVYDPYKGVLSYIKVVDGEFQANQPVQLIHTKKTIRPTEVGHFNPEYQSDKKISEGQIGYLITGEKSVRDAKIGDTIIRGLTIKKDSGRLQKEDYKGIDKKTFEIIGECMKIHNELGSGLKENLYQKALKIALEKKGYNIKEETPININYEGETIGKGKIDLLIDNEIIIELKVIGFLNKKFFQQTRTYLQNTDAKLALLIDFGSSSLQYKRLEKDNLQYKNSKNLLESIESSGILTYSIPGFKTSKPFVYAGVYPIETSEYDKLKEALEKLSLNDSSIEHELEDSKALGFGFRCGFLGMLHMDIIKERLSREYGIETIFTTPTVVYLIKSKNLSIEVIKSQKNIKDIMESGLQKYIPDFSNTDDLLESQKSSEILKPWILVKSGADMIPQGMVEKILEPISEVEVVGPQEYAGNIMELCQNHRGKLKTMENLDETRLVWKYDMPLGEIIVDFYDKLKSGTKGFATMNYEFKGYQASDLIKLDVMVNNEPIEALSRIIHKDKSYYFARELCEKLKELIPKHMFAIPIQAAIGTKIIARETISAMKKDVLAKCYGGDVTRKRKLLQKQKEGKKKMKAMGSVSVPSDLFMKMVSRG